MAISLDSLRNQIRILKQSLPRLNDIQKHSLTAEQIKNARNDVNAWAELYSGEPQARYHIDLQHAAASHRRLIIEGAPGTGKSRQLTLRRVLWLIGNDPNIRVQIVCASAEKAIDWVHHLSEGIRSPIFKAVFPNIKPSIPWTGNTLTVQKSSRQSGPTVKGVGIESSTALGNRVDLMILDDILTSENTYTRSARERIINIVQSTTISGRLVKGGKMILIANTWTRDDLIHELAKNESWHYLRTPACDRDITYSLVPDILPIEELRQKRAEMGSVAFNCQYLCEPMGDEDSRFHLDWFNIKPDIPWSESYQCRNGESICIGIDPGIGQEKSHDPTAVCVMLRDYRGQYHVLNVITGHQTGEGTIELMMDLERRYRPKQFRVESIAAQRFLIQWASQKIHTPITAHNTTASSSSVTGKAWAMEKIPMEVERGNLLICRDKSGQWTKEGVGLRDGLMSYRPGIHTDDRVMALFCAYAGHAIQNNSGPIRIESRNR